MNGAVEVWEWISNFIQDFIRCDYLSMLGLKLIDTSKLGTRILLRTVSRKWEDYVYVK